MSAIKEPTAELTDIYNTSSHGQPAHMLAYFSCMPLFQEPRRILTLVK